MPKVRISGWTGSRLLRTPLISPTPAPSASASSTAGIVIPGSPCIRSAVSTTTRPASWPTERSIMPPITTKLWPSARMPSAADCFTTLARFCALRNSSTVAPSASSASSRTKIPWRPSGRTPAASARAPARARSFPMREQGGAVLDPAELEREVLERRCVQVGRVGRHRIAHERGPEAVVERLARGLLDADLGHRAGDQQRFDPRARAAARRGPCRGTRRSRTSRRSDRPARDRSRPRRRCSRARPARPRSAARWPFQQQQVGGRHSGDHSQSRSYSGRERNLV